MVLKSSDIPLPIFSNSMMELGLLLQSKPAFIIELLWPDWDKFENFRSVVIYEDSIFRIFRGVYQKLKVTWYNWFHIIITEWFKFVFKYLVFLFAIHGYKQNKENTQYRVNIFKLKVDCYGGHLLNFLSQKFFHVSQIDFI